jgi:gamma-tubulin complex component 2
VPAFLEAHAQLVLDCGKHLHVVRECGRAPECPDARDNPIVYSTDERALSSWVKSAWEWASAELLHLLMVEQQLMQRLASVKHYFLLDQACRPRRPPLPRSRLIWPGLAQGDFFVHFLDSAEEELVKPVAV